MRSSFIRKGILAVGAAVAVLALAAGTIPSVWACSTRENAAKSSCCCAGRKPPEGTRMEAACCCVAPDPGEHRTPDAKIERPPRQEIAGWAVAVVPPGAPTLNAPLLQPIERPPRDPLTLLSLHVSLRC